jgi:hypothetical protein
MNRLLLPAMPTRLPSWRTVRGQLRPNGIRKRRRPPFPTSSKPSIRVGLVSEAATEELSDHLRGWRGRLLWLPLVALVSASAAVVVWFFDDVVPAA